MSCYHMTLCVYKERMCVRELVSFWFSFGFSFSLISFENRVVKIKIYY